MACEFRLRFVVELLYSLPAKTDIDDQESLALVHQTYHHDFVLLCIWEFQGILGSFDIV